MKIERTDRTPRVAITHGDTNGIGYELIFRTFAETEIFDIITPIIYGSPKIADLHAKALQIDYRLNIIDNARNAMEGRLNIVDVGCDDLEVKLGTATMDSATASSRALGKALNDYKEGVYDVLVPAPANDIELHSISDYLRSQNGNTDATATQKPLTPVMMTGNDSLVLSSIFEHAIDCNIQVTKEDIIEKATQLHNNMRRDLRIDNPRIALMLNSKSSEGDENIIPAAITELAASGIQTFGPYSKELLFDERYYQHFDGILTIQPNDGINAFCDIFGNRGSRLISGLPLVISIPMDSPSFDIAGKGLAEEDSMRHAIYQAIDAFRSRHYFDIPFAHSLKKIYHERREDGDKARFAVKRDFKPHHEPKVEQ